MTKFEKMDAKSMFDELGYEFIDYSDRSHDIARCIIYKRKRKNNQGCWLEIVFNLYDKDIDIYMCDYNEFKKLRSNLSIKELQAINKQVEELGWVND